MGVILPMQISTREPPIDAALPRPPSTNRNFPGAVFRMNGTYRELLAAKCVGFDGQTVDKYSKRDFAVTRGQAVNDGHLLGLAIARDPGVNQSLFLDSATNSPTRRMGKASS